MDALDKEILNEIQWSFPLVAEPYKSLADKFHISNDEMKNRIIQLKSSGVLRQLSAIFDTRRLGYKSSLVAMAVTPEKLDYVANQINRHPGVSHNYERNHEYNLWFTLATPPGSDLKTEVDKFSKLPGILKVRLLPTIKLFKIGVKLDMVDDKKKEIAPTEEKKKINLHKKEVGTGFIITMPSFLFVSEDKQGAKDYYNQEDEGHRRFITTGKMAQSEGASNIICKLEMLCHSTLQNKKKKEKVLKIDLETLVNIAGYQKRYKGMPKETKAKIEKILNNMIETKYLVESFHLKKGKYGQEQYIIKPLKFTEN